MTVSRDDHNGVRCLVRRKSMTAVLCRVKKNCSFEAELFSHEAERIFPQAVSGENLIRSGIHIPSSMKSVISSYRLLGHSLSDGGLSRIDFIQIKLAPGVQTDEALAGIETFLSGYMIKYAASGLFAAIVPAQNDSHILTVLQNMKGESQQHLPQDILRLLACTGLKNYLAGKCQVSRLALDNFLSPETMLFDDFPIASKAQELDRALAELSFCDPACSSGIIVPAAALAAAALRFALNKYLGHSRERTEEVFISHFYKNSLHVITAKEVTAQLLFAAAALHLKEAMPNRKHFICGDLLKESARFNEKYDLIISNPPHLRGDSLHALKAELVACSSARFNADLYCYYVEKMASMLTPGGSCELLVSSKWKKARYGQGLRDFFEENGGCRTTELDNRPLPESSLPGMCMLSYREKGGAAAEEEPLVLSCEQQLPAENTPAEIFSSDRAESLSLRLAQKIRAKSITLSEYVDGKIYRGIMTGLNKAFVLKKTEADRLTTGEQGSSELLIPFHSGREVKRYFIKKTDKKLIFLPKGYTDANRGFKEGREWLSSNHPLLYSHFMEYENEARRRRDKGDYWWELRPCSYSKSFEKSCIILPVITDRLSAALSEAGEFFNDKCTFIDSEDFFLLGLLNSKLMDFIARLEAPSLLGNYFEIRPGLIRNLPVIKNTAAEKKLQLIEEIAACAKNLTVIYEQTPPLRYGRAPEEAREQEKRINRAVNNLYALSPEEVSLIENY